MDVFNVGIDHVAEIESWLQKRNMEKYLARRLPKLGYIAPGIAAGFLAMLEGSAGVMDSFISNPDRGSLERHLALDAIIDKLISDAQHMGLKRIMAFSVDDGIVKRQKHKGFVKLPHTLTILELSGG